MFDISDKHRYNYVTHYVGGIYMNTTVSESSSVIIALSIYFLMFFAFFLFAVLISLATHFAEAIPLYKLAKKMDRKNAALVWIPVFGSYFRLYTLMNIASGKDFVLTQKIRTDKRHLSFLAGVGTELIIKFVIMPILMTILTFSAFLGLIPVVGPILFFGIYILGAFLCMILNYAIIITYALIRYVYLRDVLDIFKADKDTNNTTSILITLIDIFATGGFARIIFLYTIMNRDPIPEEITDEIAEESAEAETVSV